MNKEKMNEINNELMFIRNSLVDNTTWIPFKDGVVRMPLTEQGVGGFKKREQELIKEFEVAKNE